MTAAAKYIQVESLISGKNDSQHVTTYNCKQIFQLRYSIQITNINHQEVQCTPNISNVHSPVIQQYTVHRVQKSITPNSWQ